MEQNIEVKQLSEREVCVGESSLRLIEDDILCIAQVGDSDDEKARIVKEIGLKFFNAVKGKVNILVDLNKAGKQSAGARKIWKELDENERTGKVAIFGMHPVARVLASFVMGATSKKDMKFFKTMEEALAWLKE